MEALAKASMSSKPYPKLGLRSHPRPGLPPSSPHTSNFPPRSSGPTKSETNSLVSSRSKNVQIIVNSNSTDYADVGIEFDTDMPSFQQLRLSDSVRVKFQLQKDCIYGEQILLVGDHPMIGSWDPTKAIGLSWSDGNIWTVKMDLPVNMTMQYKFILRGNDGGPLWQPGPDRILKTWENLNMIVVTEDWENAEEQKITEGEQALTNQLEDPSMMQEIEHQTKNEEDQGMNRSEELTMEHKFALMCASTASFNQGLDNSPENGQVEPDEYAETQKIKEHMKNTNHDETGKAAKKQEEDKQFTTSDQEGSVRLSAASVELTEEAVSQEHGSSNADGTTEIDPRTADVTSDNFST